MTATARCLDLATALVLDSGVLLITSPDMTQPLLQRLDKYIFPSDGVTVADVSAACRMLTLLGPQADDVLTELAGVRRAPAACSWQRLSAAGQKRTRLAPTLLLMRLLLCLPTLQPLRRCQRACMHAPTRRMRSCWPASRTAATSCLRLAPARPSLWRSAAAWRCPATR